ncbi:hypothetical protein [Floridanema evergladense]
MEHKAFVFDYDAFTSEFSSTLETALITNNTEKLVSFIEQNIDFLKDPYEGEPLDNNWQSMLEIDDPQQCGDFAITKFYDPQNDVGLGYSWEKIQNILKEEFGIPWIIFGDSFVANKNYFDPGKMGSYFQSPTLVKQNLSLIKDLLEQKPQYFSVLEGVIKMLQNALAQNLGLYVAF